MNDICEIVIYTSDAALSFNIVATVENFQERLASALEEGTVVLDTIDGTKLILNAINAVAIEVHDAKSAYEIPSDTPPISKI